MGGCVIFNASTGAYQPPAMIAVYAMTKTAFSLCRRHLPPSWCRSKIRIDAVSPGLIRIKMSQPLLERDTIKQEGGVKGMKRVGEAFKVAVAIAYLVSEDASHVTREALIVSGGTDSHGIPDVDCSICV
ncbi:Dehydrogenase/reductase SDR family member 4 [Aphelenchoides besseyi]|nr:Dehydrogenase/reductase SDR family member 4 [Aphelenchoides besseyi]